MKYNENNIFLIDLEYCVGEMNYIGDLSNSMIPTPDEIRLFTNIVRQGLTKINILIEIKFAWLDHHEMGEAIVGPIT